MIRLIRFQFAVRCIGMTGCMFSTFWVPLYGPTPKFMLSCSGTLIRSATGFCVAFCSAWVELASRWLDAFACGLLPPAAGFSWADSVPQASRVESESSRAARLRSANMSRPSICLTHADSYFIARRIGASEFSMHFSRSFTLDEGRRLACLESILRIEPSEELDEFRHTAAPSRLVTRTEPRAVVTVEVFVEENMVLPMRVGLEFLRSAVDRSPAMLVLQEDSRNAVGDLLGHLEQVHQLARARRDRKSTRL